MIKVVFAPGAVLSQWDKRLMHGWFEIDRRQAANGYFPIYISDTNIKVNEDVLLALQK